MVIKATELNTGSEETPAAGTSLMFLVRVMVGLLAFAPALTHRFNKEAAAAASSASEVLTSQLTSAPALSPGSATGGLELPLVETPQYGAGAVVDSRGVAGVSKETENEMGGAWETLFWPGMLSGVFMFLGDAGQALGLETSTADHAAVLLTGSVSVPGRKESSRELVPNGFEHSFGTNSLSGGSLHLIGIRLEDYMDRVYMCSKILVFSS